MNGRYWAVLLVPLLIVAGCGDDAAEEVPAPAADEEAAAIEPAEAPESAPERAELGDDAVAPAAAEPGPDAAELPADPLYTVQVASFIHADSAQILARRLMGREVPIWISEQEVGGRQFHRVRVGAFTDLSAAGAFGEEITAEYGWPVWIAPVVDREAVPPDAVAETSAAL